MTATIPNAFRRLTLSRDLWGHSAYRCVFWALTAATLGIVLLLVLGLCLALLVNRGELDATVAPQEFVEFESRYGQGLATAEVEKFRRQLEAASDAAAKADVPLAVDEAASKANDEIESLGDIRIQLRDCGIFPTVWRTRNAWYGRLAAIAFRKFSWLQNDLGALILLLFTAAVTGLLKAGALSQLRLTSRSAALEAGAGLRRAIYRQAARLGPEDLRGRDTITAEKLLVEEVQSIEEGLFRWMYQGSRYPAELLLLAVLAVCIDPMLTVQWIFPLGLCWYLFERGERMAGQATAVAGERTLRELDLLKTSVSRLRVTRGYGLEQADQEEFNDHLKRYVKQAKLTKRMDDDTLWLRLFVLVTCAFIVMFLLFLTLGKVLVSGGTHTVTGVLVFLGVLGLMYPRITAVVRLNQLRHELGAKAGHVYRYVDEIPSVSQAVGAKFIEPLRKVLAIEGVSYSLPDSPILLLDHVNLKLVAGREYAVIAIDPMEAKALVSMLPRFIEPRAGRILYDGEDIAWGTLESLRAETIFVGAGEPPLDCSIRDNIRAGRQDFSSQQVMEAAKESHAHKFISALRDGYETILDSRTNELDVGQLFRLSLARAILRQPAVLIIEEPTVALDDDTKALLEDAFTRISKNRTVIYLPNRLTTLRRADQTIVLCGGRVVAMGPHEVLVRESPIYRHWEYLHFNEFRHLGDAGAV